MSIASVEPDGPQDRLDPAQVSPLGIDKPHSSENTGEEKAGDTFKRSTFVWSAASVPLLFVNIFVCYLYLGYSGFESARGISLIVLGAYMVLAELAAGVLLLLHTQERIIQFVTKSIFALFILLFGSCFACFIYLFDQIKSGFLSPDGQGIRYGSLVLLNVFILRKDYRTGLSNSSSLAGRPPPAPTRANFLQLPIRFGDEADAGGKALYMHCLPADITDVSCKAGEVAATVFDRYRDDTYREASWKPYIIAAMILLGKEKDPAGLLAKMLERASPRVTRA